MKKLLFSALAVLLAAAMSVTFFACKKNDEPETDASGNTIVKIMVHVAEQSAEGKAYKQVTDYTGCPFRNRARAFTITRPFSARRACFPKWRA